MLTGGPDHRWELTSVLYKCSTKVRTASGQVLCEAFYVIINTITGADTHKESKQNTTEWDALLWLKHKQIMSGQMSYEKKKLNQRCGST